MFRFYTIIDIGEGPFSTHFAERELAGRYISHAARIVYIKTLSTRFIESVNGRASLAQTRETAQIYGSRILIAPPTSAYTQYK